MVLCLVFYCLSYLLYCMFMLYVGLNMSCRSGEMCLVSELEWIAGFG